MHIHTKHSEWEGKAGELRKAHGTGTGSLKRAERSAEGERGREEKARRHPQAPVQQKRVRVGLPQDVRHGGRHEVPGETPSRWARNGTGRNKKQADFFTRQNDLMRYVVPGIQKRQFNQKAARVISDVVMW